MTTFSKQHRAIYIEILLMFNDDIIFNKLVSELYFPNAASELPNPNSTWVGEIEFSHALTRRSFIQRHVHKPEFLTYKKVP